MRKALFKKPRAGLTVRDVWFRPNFFLSVSDSKGDCLLLLLYVSDAVCRKGHNREVFDSVPRGWIPEGEGGRGAHGEGKREPRDRGKKTRRAKVRVRLRRERAAEEGLEVKARLLLLGAGGRVEVRSKTRPRRWFNVDKTPGALLTRVRRDGGPAEEEGRRSREST